MVTYGPVGPVKSWTNVGTPDSGLEIKKGTHPCVPSQLVFIKVNPPYNLSEVVNALDE